METKYAIDLFLNHSLVLSNPEGHNQWTKGGSTSGHHVGDRVRINPDCLEEGDKKSGVISESAPSGKFHAVADSKGNHLGYFHESDLASKERKAPKDEDTSLSCSDLVLGDSPGHPFRGNQFTPGGEEHADKVGHQHKVGDRVHILPIQENGTINKIRNDASGNPIIHVTRDSDKVDHLARTFELGPERGAIDTGIVPPPAPPKSVLDVGGIAGRVGLHPSPDQLPLQIPRHNDPVYREPTKWPKYNGMVNPLNADYRTAGKILRQRLPNLSKDDHVVYGNQHFANAKDMQAQHTALVNKMIKKMGGDPRRPTDLQQDKFGPLISGVVSEKFPDKVKNKLRDLAQGSSASQSAGLAHYAAAGKKLDTARAKMQED